MQHLAPTSTIPTPGLDHSAKGPMDWQHHPGVVFMDLPPSGGKHPAAGNRNEGTHGYPNLWIFQENQKKMFKKNVLYIGGTPISGNLQLSWDSYFPVILLATATTI